MFNVNDKQQNKETRMKRVVVGSNIQSDIFNEKNKSIRLNSFIHSERFSVPIILFSLSITTIFIIFNYFKCNNRTILLWRLYVARYRRTGMETCKKFWCYLVYYIYLFENSICTCKKIKKVV